MSDRHSNEYSGLTETQRRAVDAVESLSRPTADVDFRARLKASFVDGSIDSSATPPATDSTAASSSTSTSSTQKPFAPAKKSRGPWMPWATMAAAAVILVALFSAWNLAGPEAMGAHKTGTVVVDGRSVAAADSNLLDELLKPGSVVEVLDGAEIDIIYPGSFVVRVSSGTTLTLPKQPRRWFAQELNAEMAAGEISIRTGPQLAGNVFNVSTPEGQVHIYGTLVSVFRNDDLTCVCLYEGTAVMDNLEKELGPIPAGKRWVLYRNGNAAELLDIAPPHKAHMEGLDAARCDCFLK